MIPLQIIGKRSPALPFQLTRQKAIKIFSQIIACFNKRFRDEYFRALS